MAGKEAVRISSIQTAVLPPLVQAMMSPDFYPERPLKVDLVQTHISDVFLVGDYVYKLKKAVKFPFLDCSDLAHRFYFCAEEVRLNWRLAPDVYLGIFPILRQGPNYVLGPQTSRETASAVDYVVKMRRLPADRMLDRLVAGGKADATTIRAIAAKIAEFYSRASAAQAEKFASAAQLWILVIGELVDVGRLVGFSITPEQLGIIERYCRTFISSHRELLSARSSRGRVREGHGDLRCEHICVEDAKISIFDCVEFSERLRYCDIASEIAFLAMDLDRLGAPDLAGGLVRTIAELTDDADLATLVPFYKCYRAVIRGAVESLRSRELDVAPDDRRRAVYLASGYFAMACRYAASATPAMVVICGLSGSGKSTLARALRDRIGFPIVNSDQARKRLAAIPPMARTSHDYNMGIYDDAMTETTYGSMLHEAEKALAGGTGVILDATYKDAAHRQAVMDLGSRLGVGVLFIECVASDAEICRRLAERERAGRDVSDATIDVYLRQKGEFAPLDEIFARSHVRVDTTQPPARVIIEIENALERLRCSSRTCASAPIESGAQQQIH